mmetsp:Transcript_22546/g.43890  ORF Transcript_22546/g.43890 Transcript_22546/m.43890 type:complete len:201 (-) Transcript_22546:881-1483(-)
MLVSTVRDAYILNDLPSSRVAHTCWPCSEKAECIGAARVAIRSLWLGSLLSVSHHWLGHALLRHALLVTHVVSLVLHLHRHPPSHWHSTSHRHSPTHWHLSLHWHLHWHGPPVAHGVSTILWIASHGHLPPHRHPRLLVVQRHDVCFRLGFRLRLISSCRDSRSFRFSWGWVIRSKDGRQKIIRRLGLWLRSCIPVLTIV